LVDSQLIHMILKASRWRRDVKATAVLGPHKYDWDTTFNVSASYRVHALLDVAPDSIENDAEMAKRWQIVINEAFMESRAKHFGQTSAPFNRNTVLNDTQPVSSTLRNNERTIDVQLSKKKHTLMDFQIVGNDCGADGCVQTFVVFYNRQLVPAEVISFELGCFPDHSIGSVTVITSPDISAPNGPDSQNFHKISTMKRSKPLTMSKQVHDHLHIMDVHSQFSLETVEIAATVIGGGIAVIMCGWLTLFIYYNTCGRPHQAAEGNSMVRKIYFKDQSAQSEMEANDNEAADGVQYRCA
uniref:Integrin_alpha2 domain-containing protein n=1 Tax=Anisakis simplex TaxID=6269 RepID=A0A0M3JR31_ANISI